MKINEQGFANASAVLTGIVYIACSLLVVLFPDYFKIVGQSWFHGIDISLIWTGEPRGNFFIGLATAVAGTWLAGWAFAWTYNRFAKSS